jgi:hypothetical protein
MVVFFRFSWCQQSSDFPDFQRRPARVAALRRDLGLDKPFMFGMQLGWKLVRGTSGVNRHARLGDLCA